MAIAIKGSRVHPINYFLQSDIEEFERISQQGPINQAWREECKILITETKKVRLPSFKPGCGE